MQAVIFPQAILFQISFEEDTVLGYFRNNSITSALGNIWKEYEKLEKNETVEKLQFLR